MGVGGEEAGIGVEEVLNCFRGAGGGGLGGGGAGRGLGGEEEPDCRDLIKTKVLPLILKALG